MFMQTTCFHGKSKQKKLSFIDKSFIESSFSGQLECKFDNTSRYYFVQSPEKNVSFFVKICPLKFPTIRVHCSFDEASQKNFTDDLKKLVSKISSSFFRSKCYLLWAPECTFHNTGTIVRAKSDKITKSNFFAKICRDTQNAVLTKPIKQPKISCSKCEKNCETVNFSKIMRQKCSSRILKSNWTMPDDIFSLKVGKNIIFEIVLLQKIFCKNGRLDT